MASSPNSLEWHEWLCHSNFSFLCGASHPEEYMERAQSLSYQGIGICDFDGAYGLVRAYRYGREHSSQLRLYYGAEMHLRADHQQAIIYQDTLVLKARSLEGYQNLCRIITESHRHSKREPYIELERLCQMPNKDVIAIQPMRGLIRSSSQKLSLERYAILKECFSERFFLAVSRHLNPVEDLWISRTLGLAKDLTIPILFSQDAFFHDPKRKELSDILHAIRLNQELSACLSQMFVNSERSLQSKDSLFKRYQVIPGFAKAIDNSKQLAQSFDFSLSQISYQYPKEMIPAGFKAQSYLEFLVWRYTYSIYPNPPDRLLKTLQQELKLIASLEFADYFLTVWDIVQWAREQDILCQGRGSAANSAICFVLGITAVDPSIFDLLFERFISLERGDPPDIDVDFEHERREEVIQYIYRRYGRGRAAMVANVITFRSRGAIRAVGKALGIGEELLKQANQIQELRAYRRESSTEGLAKLELEQVAKPEVPWQTWGRLADALKGFPRHLGIHSGGFIVSHQALDTIVPQEPATMTDRTVVQWSKDDIEALGLFKIDILALGILTAIRKCFKMIQKCHGQKLDLASIPEQDAATYAMIQRAATVGTFQIESRAQMSMLPRLRPRTFYDLVVQVGIIRPGPIQGGLIHPYLRRRHGLEPITYPHPKLRPILQRTLGVPIFQEQIMRMAMAVGEFTAAEADQLRKQIGAWSLKKGLGDLIDKLAHGMRHNGISEQHIRQTIDHLRGFADYGFPESHAASFALLAYASSYLKCHFQEAYYTAILNSQPMGFYSIHALLRSAEREGSTILPISVNHSYWDISLEAIDASPSEKKWAIRLGLRLVAGLSQTGAKRLLEQRQQRGLWLDLDDFLQSQTLHRGDLTALTAANALQELGAGRRAALWLAEAAPFAPLLEEEGLGAYHFVAEDQMEAIERDFAAFSSTLGPHPCQVIKQNYWSYPLSLQSIQVSSSLAKLQAKQDLCVFGMVLVRQAPPTAKGMVFFTLEDETGFINLAFKPAISTRYHALINRQGFICAKGTLQLSGGYHSILVHTVYQPELPDEKPRPLHSKHQQKGEKDQAARTHPSQKSLTHGRNYM